MYKSDPQGPEITTLFLHYTRQFIKIVIVKLELNSINQENIETFINYVIINLFIREVIMNEPVFWSLFVSHNK